MTGKGTALLEPARDPAPVEWVNAAAAGPVLLVCEHAGQAIPAALGDLGLAPGQIDLHIGWDIGAAAVTRRLADLLGAPAILQRYSRLVIDGNRPPEAASAFPAISDGVRIPGNEGLPAEERSRRHAAIFEPFDLAVSAARARPGLRLLLSVHSFTPRLQSRGADRPWHLGFLYRADHATSERLAAIVARHRPDLVIGMNEPYQVTEEEDWFVPRHGEASGIAHTLLEIRNDLIDSPEGQEAMAQLLSRVVADFLALPTAAPSEAPC